MFLVVDEEKILAKQKNLQSKRPEFQYAASYGMRDALSLSEGLLSALFAEG
jgi:hypothetical protein